MVVIASQGATNDGNRTMTSPLHISTDARLNPALASEVAGLRGGMAAAAERIDVPARFDFHPHSDLPRMIITDMETGRQAEVTLGGYHAVRTALAGLFGDAA